MFYPVADYDLKKTDWKFQLKIETLRFKSKL